MVIIKVRDIRRRKGITDRQLSEMTKISKSQISRKENNQQSPTIDVLCKIAMALDVDIRETFEYVPDDPPNNS